MGWDPGSEIRDPEKTYSGSWIQGSKRHCIPCIKFASARDQTRVACVTGGHSTLRAIKTVVGATHLTAREGSNPPPQNLPQPVEISITIQHNSMGSHNSMGPGFSSFTFT